MKLKSILSLTALAGALATTTAAHADHPRRDWRTVESWRGGVDVIATARLHAKRGVASFRITPEMRRDGLQLWTDSRGLRLLGVDLEYSDGRVERLRGRMLRFAVADDGLVTIQRGRPPGLRFVHVRYALDRFDRSAQLQLIQIHDGDGYTSEADLRHQRDGWYEYDPAEYEYGYDRNGYGYDRNGYGYDRYESNHDRYESGYDRDEYERPRYRRRY